MALHITNSAVEQKVRKLAALTNESITGAIDVAVDQRLTRVKAEHKPEQETVESILALVRSFNLQRIHPDLTEDEILGYGPNGYPE